MAAQIQSQLPEGVEVVPRGHGSARTLVPADGKVLPEGRGALDGRLVDALVLVDVVGRAVAVHGAQQGVAAAGVVGEVLHDVVLDQRVRGPAIDTHVRISGRVVGAGESDGAEQRTVSLAR